MTLETDRARLTVEAGHVTSRPGTGHAAPCAADPSDWPEQGHVSPDYERMLFGWLHARLA